METKPSEVKEYCTVGELAEALKGLPPDTKITDIEGKPLWLWTWLGEESAQVVKLV